MSLGWCAYTSVSGALGPNLALLLATPLLALHATAFCAVSALGLVIFASFTSTFVRFPLCGEAAAVILTCVRTGSIDGQSAHRSAAVFEHCPQRR